MPATCSCPELTGSVHDRFMFRIMILFTVVGTLPNPQAERPPLVGCPRLFIQYIRSYPPYGRPLRHRTPEEASCRGDRAHLSRGSIAAVSLSVLSVRNCSFFSRSNYSAELPSSGAGNVSEPRLMSQVGGRVCRSYISAFGAVDVAFLCVRIS